jgi:diguanylate cyclase (GGDEF)-like protein
VAQAIDRKQRENESFFIGTHDQLTGLYNRTFFEEEISRLEKSRHFPVSIFMFDVDDLKTVNDTQGHPAGDELLKRAANVLKESFRPEDMVARIGGDEYVAILPRTTKETAKLALERVKHFLERNNKNNQNKLRISIGIATCEKQSSLAETLKQADDRMYLDKRSKG